MTELQKTLARVQRRIFVQQWIRYTAVGLMYASGVAGVWLLATRLLPQLGHPFFGCTLVFAAAIVAAFAMAVSRRPSILRAAVETDVRLGLRERLTSSLQLSGMTGPMVEAVHADAHRHLKNLRLPEAFPLAGSGRLRWVYATLAAFGLAYVFLPEFDLTQHRARQAEASMDQEVRTVQAERLKEAVRPIEKIDEASSPELAAAVKALEATAEELKNAQITEKQALARVASLAEKLEKHRNALALEQVKPKLAKNPEGMGSGEEAASMTSGKMGEAAKRLEDLKEKLKNKESLGEKEKQEAMEELQKLANMMGGNNSELGNELAKALAKLGSALNQNDMESAMEALEQAALSVEDLESLLMQLEMTDTMMAELQQWKGEFLGPSAFCRSCGAALKKCEHGEDCGSCGAGTMGYGLCGNCAGFGTGLGLGGGGRGQGNQVGELPDLPVGFNPTMLKGPMTQGQMLASILQKGDPEEGAEATTEFVSGAFVEVQQAAEQALTKEEIPEGAKEFVRQYFGSLEPQQNQNP